ncbi:MAG: Crp/Fnr family transcriptional regulator [bacterium]|nr:Crp/Fnr family transcriptional regulator [bacterium]
MNFIKKNLKEVLFNTQLWVGLSRQECEEIFQLLPEAEIKEKAQEIYRSGSIGILLDGKATVLQGNNRKDVIMRTVAAGDFFGSASLFESNYQSSIKANTVCRVLYIPDVLFEHILNSYPKVAVNYIRFLSGRICFLNRQIENFTCDNTEVKILNYLYQLAGEKEEVHLEYGISQLSSRLNMGRTSIYRAIDNLTKYGKIRREKNIFYINKKE